MTQEACEPIENEQEYIWVKAKANRAPVGDGNVPTSTAIFRHSQVLDLGGCKENCLRDPASLGYATWALDINSYCWCFTNTTQLDGLEMYHDALHRPGADEIKKWSQVMDSFQGYELAEKKVGCMDSNACNFDKYANTEDGSCITPDCLNVCGLNKDFQIVMVGGEDAGRASTDICGVCNGDGKVTCPDGARECAETNCIQCSAENAETITTKEEAVDDWYGPSTYRGCQSKTVTGRTCQKWTSQLPHQHESLESLAEHGLEASGILGDHNYCRAQFKETIWCYTTDPEKEKEECEVIADVIPCKKRTDCYGKSCVAWLTDGESCETLENVFECDCSGCEACAADCKVNHFLTTDACEKFDAFCDESKNWALERVDSQTGCMHCKYCREKGNMTVCPECGQCESSCWGESCDYWVTERGYTCPQLEAESDCDCGGCECSVAFECEDKWPHKEVAKDWQWYCSSGLNKKYWAMTTRCDNFWFANSPQEALRKCEAQGGRTCYIFDDQGDKCAPEFACDNENATFPPASFEAGWEKYCKKYDEPAKAWAMTQDCTNAWYHRTADLAVAHCQQASEKPCFIYDNAGVKCAECTTSYYHTPWEAGATPTDTIKHEANSCYKDSDCCGFAQDVAQCTHGYCQCTKHNWGSSAGDAHEACSMVCVGEDIMKQAEDNPALRKEHKLDTYTEWSRQCKCLSLTPGCIMSNITVCKEEHGEDGMCTSNMTMSDGSTCPAVFCMYEATTTSTWAPPPAPPPPPPPTTTPAPTENPDNQFTTTNPAGGAPGGEPDTAPGGDDTAPGGDDTGAPGGDMGGDMGGGDMGGGMDGGMDGGQDGGMDGGMDSPSPSPSPDPSPSPSPNEFDDQGDQGGDTGGMDGADMGDMAGAAGAMAGGGGDMAAMQAQMR